MRFLICLMVICYIITDQSSRAQTPVKIGIQSHIIPTLQVNSLHFDHRTAEGIQLVFSNLREYPFELGGHIFRGYDSSVDFSYGVFFAYSFLNISRNWFKVGLETSRFMLNDYKRSYEAVGSEIEDDLPTSLKPYIAWEWGFSKSFSLLIKGGYRIMASETSTITDIIYETNAVTGEQKPTLYQTAESLHFYGSGFEFGLGLSVNFN